jgi:peptidoglycan hydrolase CwlO-like protein
MKEPKQTCPMIDDLIRELEDLKSHLESETPYEDILHQFFSNNAVYYWNKSKGSLIDALEDIRSANSEIRDWGKSLETEIEALQEKVSSLESDISSLENDVDSLQGELSNLQEDYDTLKLDLERELRGDCK